MITTMMTKITTTLTKTKSTVIFTIYFNLCNAIV